MNIDEVTRWLTSAELKPEDITKLPQLVLAATAHEIGHSSFPGAPAPNLKLVEKDDELLTPEQAARMLGVTLKWIYAHKRQLPYVAGLSRKTLRFSRKGLQRYIAARVNRDS